MREMALSVLEESQAAIEEAEEALPMDEESFRGFYERTARPLRAYLSRALGDFPLAEDLMQEAYYRFLRSASSEMGEVYCRNYLFRIATNLLRDHWRRRKGDPEPLPEGFEI